MDQTERRKTEYCTLELRAEAYADAIEDGVPPSEVAQYVICEMVCAELLADLEKGLLGSILIDPAKMGAADAVAPEMFADARHARIFEAMVSLSKSGTGIDLLTVQYVLDKAGRLDAAGGAAYLSSLVDRVPDVENAASYAAGIAEYAKRTALAAGAREQLNLLDADAISAKDFGRNVRALVPEIKADGGRVILRELHEVISGIRKREPISLGLPHLDRLLGGGISAGEAIVIGGGPGTLKTTMFARMVGALCGPRAAVFAVLFDEPHERVCRKIAADLGIAYESTEEPTEDTLGRIRAEVTRRDGFFRVVDPSTAPSVEEFIEACLAATPADRVPVFLIDHLHKLFTDTATDRDQTPTLVGKVVDAVLKATARGAAVAAISEVTKAATSYDVVRENPASVFADTRAILSRFDAGFAAAKVPEPVGSDAVTVEVFGTGKNRLGDGKTGFMLSLGLRPWRLTTSDSSAYAEERREHQDRAKRAKALEQDSADENAVLSYVTGHAVSQAIGCRRRDVERGLPADGTVGEVRVRKALVRLERGGRLEAHEWKAKGSPGKASTYVRMTAEASR